MLLTAPGNTSQMPTVATVSMAPWRGPRSRSRELIRRRRRARHGGPASELRLRGRRTFDRDIQTSRRGDAGDDAERNLLALEQWALLDVQFNECLVISGGSLTVSSGPAKPAFSRTSSSDLAVAVFQASAQLRRSSVPESMRLPMHPMPKRVGSSDVNITSSMESRGAKSAAL